jgi:DNA-binding GntR family transcriptional regulator
MSQYKSKVDIIYEILMNKIAKGAYKEDSRLIISQIAKQNHMSDIPVREAIRRLESEGYVEINANHGATVLEFSDEVIDEIFHIKGVLEGYATRLSVDYLTERDIKKLRSKNQLIRKAGAEHNYTKFAQLNMQFHLDIYDSTPYHELYSMICDLWKKWRITRCVFSLAPDRMEISFLEHEEILRLIEEKRYDQVELYVREHKFKAGQAFRKSIGISN